MKVLADFHHHDLWESLQIVFRDRFGWELYRPIGMDWFDQEYWNFERAWHGDAVAKQYLTLWGDDVDAGDHWTRADRSHIGRDHLMLTLDQARDLRPDVVISSVAHNHEGLARFAREVGAKFGLHLGNVRFSTIDMAEDRWDLADFGILTTTSPLPPPKPHVTVHQEFSLTDFRPAPPPRGEKLVASSFVNCFAETAWAYDEFKAVAQAHPEWDWRVYGSYGTAPLDDYACGNLGICADVGAAMRASDVAWHTKRWSDGFGHVIHDWFSVGRPVFGHESYYRDQLAGPLWIDGETSFDLEHRSHDEVAAILARISGDEDYHLRLCENAAKRFREVVDFDEDARRIRNLIEGLA